MNTAQIILSQLNYNKPIFWSWGAHAFKSVSPTQLPELGNHLGSLIFKSNGRLRKGHVAISLMGNDTYTIHFGSFRKGKFTTTLKKEQIYAEDLHQSIDEEIESQ